MDIQEIPRGRARVAFYAMCAAKGMTRAETAARLGVTPQAVGCAARKHRLKFKPGKPGRRWPAKEAAA